jgi:hypothetical protein
LLLRGSGSDSDLFVFVSFFCNSLLNNLFDFSFSLNSFANNFSVLPHSMSFGFLHCSILLPELLAEKISSHLFPVCFSAVADFEAGAATSSHLVLWGTSICL